MIGVFIAQIKGCSEGWAADARRPAARDKRIDCIYGQGDGCDRHVRGTPFGIRATLRAVAKSQKSRVLNK